jgi:hypothetical protein
MTKQTLLQCLQIGINGNCCVSALGQIFFQFVMQSIIPQPNSNHHSICPGRFELPLLSLFLCMFWHGALGSGTSLFGTGTSQFNGAPRNGASQSSVTPGTGVSQYTQHVASSSSSSIVSPKDDYIKPGDPVTNLNSQVATSSVLSTPTPLPGILLFSTTQRILKQGLKPTYPRFNSGSTVLPGPATHKHTT